MLNPDKYLQLGPEVREGEAVVALESTVISHGLPYPENLETAQALEEVVRAKGATPATIALLDGKIRVGLGQSELHRLATEKGVAKVSRRDLPVVLARQGLGATTVAATMYAASLAKIRVFGTGGLGGVHRGATTSFDISADLTELARTPVIVVCAGAKAILDLPLTLEYLETQGVPVIGYKTDELPAFYTSKSGLKLEAWADSAAEIARIARIKWDLGLGGGMVVTVPPPPEADLPPQEIEKAIGRALAAAEQAGVKGKAVTPFLLNAVRLETEGKSLETNVALLKNNVSVAAEIALALLDEGPSEMPEELI
ncbi:MAG: pseudouridine-5'-phosphate glycosidase [Chloroflexi bacterium]|nr:pseudouridine-5'-phosphate glycosidase [Chloroflexota bacterium]OJV95218.1 MAG: pseudouridine-5-phosphate glycosidase [Chloroflexi bacterium 54-19]